MDEKTTMEKLQILLPHWIEHNHNHETEFKKWVDLVRSEGQGGWRIFWLMPWPAWPRPMGFCKRCWRRSAAQAKAITTVTITTIIMIDFYFC